MFEKLQETVSFLNKKLNFQPEIGLVLGSGLSAFADTVAEPTVLPYSEIPNFVKVTVKGHKGRFVTGKVSGKEVAILQGRFHYYEGFSMEEVTFPARVLARLGCKLVILTNAAGGVNTSFTPGDLMIIKDHINMMGVNPLRGKNDERLGPRFPDMTYVYKKEYRDILKKVAKDNDIDIKEGVYCAMMGPTYETPAEIKMIRTIGGDAAGMSTVPEAIVLRHMGVDVAGISCITNMAAGILDQELTHEEVTEIASKVKDKFIHLLTEFIKEVTI